MSSNDILIKLDSLEKQISLVQNNVNFSLSLTWAILGAIIAAMALTSFFSIKSWFNKRFNEEAKRIDRRVYSFLKENPQLLWAKGTSSIVSWEVKENGRYEITYIITGLSKFKKDNLIYVDAYYLDNGVKVSLSDNHMIVSDDGIKISFITALPFNQNVHLHYFVLWTNPIYQDIN